jgi:hypothetical protein
MVRERALVDPLAPEVGGPVHPLVGLVDAPRAAPFARPAERRVGRLTLAQRRPRSGEVSLEAHAQRAVQQQAQLAALGHCDRLAVSGPGVLPPAALGAVVEQRRALHVQVDETLHAAGDPHHAVLGLVIRRRAAVARLALLLVVPGADGEEVVDDEPARPRHPRRLQDHRARQVAPRRRDRHVGRPKPEAAGVAVEDRCEHARRVELRSAEPLDAAARRNQRPDLAVGEVGVLGDGRERAHRPARVRRRQATGPEEVPSGAEVELPVVAHPRPA